MVKEVDLFITVPIGIKFGELLEHAPLIVPLFIPILKLRYWRRPWTIRGRYFLVETIIDLEREYKIYW